jgi:uncharacterized protein YndB with AHSA1/START domain
MELTRHVTLPADPVQAWDLLTRPDDLAGWLGREVELDPTPGAAGTVTDHDGTRRHLVVEEVVPGERLAWRWWTEEEGDGAGSRVEITVAPSGSGALVTVIERPLPVPPGRSRLANALAAGAATAEAWSHRFLQLEALLLSVPTPA